MVSLRDRDGKEEVEAFRDGAADAVMHAHVLAGPKLHEMLGEMIVFYNSMNASTILSQQGQQERVVATEHGTQPLWAMLESVFFMLKGTIPYQCDELPIIGTLRCMMERVNLLT
jgi:hypothetical protein